MRLRVQACIAARQLSGGSVSHLDVELLVDGVAVQDLLHNHELGLVSVAQQPHQIAVIEVAADLDFRYEIFGDL